MVAKCLEKHALVYSESIPDALIEQRFALSKGRCECCNKNLVKSYRGKNRFGGWEAHLVSPGVAPSIETIKIVCSSGLNCHRDCCHKGTYINKPVWNPCQFYKPWKIS
ncbi:MAG TPA: hypothetical protein VKM55_24215 [Candidatus Lokiarchaeia archaeon]|nr:hypothetical protein [Candidatus Lokiarchaeia archaeon]